MNRNYFIAILLLAGFTASNTAFAQENDYRQRRRTRRAMPAVNSIYGVNLFHVTEENIGFGINYERFLDKKGMVSLYLPFSYALPQTYEQTPTSYTSNYYYSYPLSDTQNTEQHTRGMAYFYPGIKVYPWGAYKKVSYALGSSLVFGIGKADNVHTVYNIDTFTSGQEKYFTRTVKSETTDVVDAYKLGVMITNYFNLRPTKSWVFGLELGVGYSYTSRIDGKAVVDPSALVQFGFKIAYAR